MSKRHYDKSASRPKSGENFSGWSSIPEKELIKYPKKGLKKANSLDFRGKRGEKNVNAKLTVETVRQIRKLKREGKSYKYLAEKFGVKEGTISQAINHLTWKHVGETPEDDKKLALIGVWGSKDAAMKIHKEARTGFYLTREFKDFSVDEIQEIQKTFKKLLVSGNNKWGSWKGVRK